ncbi:hypothetical protein DSO57_1038252 [Entomophthora muscae]|uniref:Uncharacterized protein n=2 Tax=Entomophthora muscae TaxID=34485 RepID=A0ACC2RWC3_9FUNG|nr:hypothetical protein DSO57_1015559 [Entomophthora muscae]KAJ9063693.1 hypothetical protein DSO57_1038252 [Entomophthora muscae]
MTPPHTLQPNHPQESIATDESTSTQVFGVMYITLTGLIDSMVPTSGLWAVLGKSLSYIVKLAPILWWALPAGPAGCLPASSQETPRVGSLKVLQEGLKAKLSMLRAHKSQGSKLSQGKVVLPLTIVKILLKKVLLTLEILDKGLPKMEEAALDFSIKDGLKGSELSLLKVHYDNLWPK